MSTRMECIPAQLWAPCERFEPTDDRTLCGSCTYPLTMHSPDALEARRP